MPWSTWIRTVEIEPNLSVADRAAVEGQAEALLRTGCRVFHLDVADHGGLGLLESIAPLVHRYDGVLDVHVALESAVAGAVLRGADSVTIDAEATSARESAAVARTNDCQVGVAFPSGAQPGWSPPAGFDFDLVSIAVDDDAGSVLRVREIAKTLPLGVRVQVEGDLGHDGVRAFYQAGATVLVIGRSIFEREDLPRAYRRLVQALA